MKCKLYDIACNNAFTIVFIILAATLMLPACKKHDVPRMKAVDIKLIADNFVSPIQVVASRNSERLYVVDQIGKVWIIDKDGNKRETPLIDLTSKMVTLSPAYDERGLLGLAFHPDFKTNGRQHRAEVTGHMKKFHSKAIPMI